MSLKGFINSKIVDIISTEVKPSQWKTAETRLLRDQTHECDTEHIFQHMLSIILFYRTREIFQKGSKWEKWETGELRREKIEQENAQEW